MRKCQRERLCVKPGKQVLSGSLGRLATLAILGDAGATPEYFCAARREIEHALPALGKIDKKSLERHMKRTNHTRDNWRVRTVTPPSNDENLTRVAGACRYVGSPYHKNHPSFAGPPRSRPRTSKCPADLKDKRELMECWLRNALMSGQVGALWEGGFPRYVWHRDEDTVYEARQGSPGSGEYHGYPLMPNQVVRGLP